MWVFLVVLLFYIFSNLVYLVCFSIFLVRWGKNREIFGLSRNVYFVDNLFCVGFRKCLYFDLNLIVFCLIYEYNRCIFFVIVIIGFGRWNVKKCDIWKLVIVC